MAPFHFLCALMLPFLTTIYLSLASPDYSVQRIPLGGSLFQMEARGLKPRDGSNDLGSDCGGDPDCSTTNWGCQCGFTDGSFITDPAAPTSTKPQQPAFPSCTTIPHPKDSDYPCQCGQFHYCSNNGKCDWTSRPPAENCCEDCM